MNAGIVIQTGGVKSTISLRQNLSIYLHNWIATNEVKGVVLRALSLIVQRQQAERILSKLRKISCSVTVLLCRIRSRRAASTYVLLSEGRKIFLVINTLRLEPLENSTLVHSSLFWGLGPGRVGKIASRRHLYLRGRISSGANSIPLTQFTRAKFRRSQVGW